MELNFEMEHKLMEIYNRRSGNLCKTETYAELK